jgi:hypothetical protein
MPELSPEPNSTGGANQKKITIFIIITFFKKPIRLCCFEVSQLIYGLILHMFMNGKTKIRI